MFHKFNDGNTFWASPSWNIHSEDCSRIPTNADNLPYWRRLDSLKELEETIKLGFRRCSMCMSQTEK